MILYEYPFSERIRTYLRLEHLQRRFLQFTAKESPLDHHGALSTLFELLEVLGRPEIKSDLIKDLERQKQQFEAYRGNPEVAPEMLEKMLDRVHLALQALQNISGRMGQALFSQPFLSSMRSRIAIPAGTCAFDLPAYYAWQQEEPAVRQRHLLTWFEELKPMAHALGLSLSLLRESGTPTMFMARSGQYEQNLSNNRNYMLLRLRLSKELRLVPEISCNRMFVSIRMHKLVDEGLTQPCTDDTPLEMTLCA